MFLSGDLPYRVISKVLYTCGAGASYLAPCTSWIECSLKQGVSESDLDVNWEGIEQEQGPRRSKH